MQKLIISLNINYRKRCQKMEFKEMKNEKKIDLVGSAYDPD